MLWICACVLYGQNDNKYSALSRAKTVETYSRLIPALQVSTRYIAIHFDEPVYYTVYPRRIGSLHKTASTIRATRC